jgi:hypothetical protein
MSLWVVALCVVVIGGAVKLLAVICRPSSTCEMPNERDLSDRVDGRDMESDHGLHEGVAGLRALLHRENAGFPHQRPEVRERRDRPPAA